MGGLRENLEGIDTLEADKQVLSAYVKPYSQSCERVASDSGTIP